MFDSNRNNIKIIHFQRETQNTTCLLPEDYQCQKSKYKETYEHHFYNQDQKHTICAPMEKL